MKEFKDFSIDDKRLICEAMQIQNKAALAAIEGLFINTDEEFENVIKNMSYEAKEYMIELIKSTLPDEYKV